MPEKFDLNHIPEDKKVRQIKGENAFSKFISDILKNHSPTMRRNYAILTLREVCGWELENIGIAFNLNKGQICRVIKSTKEKLKTIAESN